LNVGEIDGGVAANVIADRASASLLLRAVETPQTTESKLRKHLSTHVELECVNKNYGPTEFFVPAGETPSVAAFGTDAPHLKNWGTPLLFGPGSIQDAHTDHECVSKSAIEQAIAMYAKTAGELLTRGASR
jgi:acetylornithine deacetylase